MITKPMLAGKCSNVALLTFPVLVTDKEDGIRCEMIGGKALTRAFKAIPNDYIRQTMELSLNSLCLDGEIITYHVVNGKRVAKCFNDISGDVRRKDGRPDFEYLVFDIIRSDLKKAYALRMIDLKNTLLPAFCKRLLPTEVKDVGELAAYEFLALARGKEGVMVRSFNSPYKCGRSTENEGYLLKIKRFEDSEATIVGFEEEMENQNIAMTDAFGRTKRSSDKAGLVPKGTLGKFVCENLDLWPRNFGIGTGFSAAQRFEYWMKQEVLLGKLVKFKYQPPPPGETHDRPRIPVFLGFREEFDL